MPDFIEYGLTSENPTKVVEQRQPLDLREALLGGLQGHELLVELRGRLDDVEAGELRAVLLNLEEKVAVECLLVGDRVEARADTRLNGQDVLQGVAQIGQGTRAGIVGLQARNEV